MLVYIGTIADKHFSHFCYLVLQKNYRHGNSLLPHAWQIQGNGSKFFALKVNAQYLFEKFRKKTSLKKSWKKVPKQHRQQMQGCKMII